MKTIWKFELTDSNRNGRSHTFSIEMPAGAEILTVQSQRNVMTLWATCNSRAPLKELRHFAVYGTGSEVPDNPGVYIGTVQMLEGSLLFHVFEIEEE